MTDFTEFIRTCDEKHKADRQRLEKLENTANSIFSILDKYKSRPTWVVTSMLTFLATALGITITLYAHVITGTH